MTINNLTKIKIKNKKNKKKISSNFNNDDSNIITHTNSNSNNNSESLITKSMSCLNINTVRSLTDSATNLIAAANSSSYSLASSLGKKNQLMIY